MKNRLLEIIGILSLSFIICSTMAVSSGIPEIMKEYPAYSLASLEFLMSSPTISILTIIALTPVLSRHLKEHTMICLGLTIIGTAGILPFFFQGYAVMLCSRIGLGVGIGFVNTYAVTLIGEHFTGELRQKLQGIRCSTETLGEASLIFIAGQLLVFGWKFSYLVYLIAFVILFLYLCFVPKEIPKETAEEEKESHHIITAAERRIIAADAGLGFLFVATLTAVAMRTSSFVVSSGFGDAVQASTVLSLSIISGFFGGILFGKMLSRLGVMLLPAALLCIGTGLCVVAFANSLLMVGMGACLFGFFATVGLSYMFNSLSDNLHAGALASGNAAVLVGCNLGAATSPFQLQFFGIINDSLSFGYLGYALVFIVIAVMILIHKLKK
ncbi:MAG: MFS transporter [Firmicutes bacterium]|nr:MFS transporter [Bacillota bacterium]